MTINRKPPSDALQDTANLVLNLRTQLTGSMTRYRSWSMTYRPMRRNRMWWVLGKRCYITRYSRAWGPLVEARWLLRGRMKRSGLMIEESVWRSRTWLKSSNSDWSDRYKAARIWIPLETAPSRLMVRIKQLWDSHPFIEAAINSRFKQGCNYN